MNWSYYGQLALSVAIFAPGLILLALFLLLRPFSARDKIADGATERGRFSNAPARDKV